MKNRTGASQRSKTRTQPKRNALRQPSRELARTWLVTVINPILRGFRKEKIWLSKQNWTWHYSANRFEHLWPSEVYVDAAYQDNYTAFLGSYLDAKRAIQRRDVALNSLAEACRTLFSKLLQTPVFIEAVAEADRTATNAGINLNEARGAMTEEQWRTLIAGYIINGISSLASYYTTAPYWQVVGESLLRVRMADPFRHEALTVDKAGKMLLVRSDRVEVVLNTIREDYTSRFGLPPVPMGSESEETQSPWRIS